MSVIGKKFGRLTVLSLRNEITDSGVRSYAKVECKCGTIKEISRQNLYRTKSCGCLRDEVRKRQIKKLKRLGYVWTYNGKKYYTAEMVQKLLKLYNFHVKESTVKGYLLTHGLKPTLKRAKEYREQRGRKVSMVTDTLGFNSVTEMINASGLSRQGFYNKIKGGFKPVRDNETIVWTK